MCEQLHTRRFINPDSVRGITALEIQLQQLEVTIPNLPQVSPSAVSVLIKFNEGSYTLPSTFLPLVAHVITADVLGADNFLQFIGEKLCLPTTTFDVSHDFLIIKKVLRDRYRLAQKVTLEYPPISMCYTCKKTLTETECLWPS